MTQATFDSIGFETPDLLPWLEAADGAALDRLPCGVIRMAGDGTVVHYNAHESKAAGLSPATVVGDNFFAGVGVCMNNVMVAARFEEAAELDAIIDYVLTLRMRPTPVRLRLLKAPGVANHYLLVDRR